MTYVELIQERRVNAFVTNNLVAMNGLVVEVLMQFEALEQSITCKCGHSVLDHSYRQAESSDPCDVCNCAWFEQ